MTVSLLEILAAARAHAAPLAAESAGYLLLAVADQLALSPRVLVADDVELQTDGSVRLRGRGSEASGDNPEQGVRRLLARTLEVSSSVGPALRRAAARRETPGLEALVRELEVALIPVNRSAARRALSRLHRETERARDQGRLEQWLRAEQAAQSAADPIAVAAEFPETVSATPAPALPAVVLAPAIVAPAPRAEVAPAPRTEVAPAPRTEVAALEPSPEPVRAAAFVSRPAPPPLDLVLSPPPPPAEEPALTKPEPVVERARARGSSTPRLGTVITAQTLPGEDGERTERAPVVALDDDQGELDVPIEVVFEADEVDEQPQALVDPSPSRMPDVLIAMRELHTGVGADEAPTRLRDVVTAPRSPVSGVGAPRATRPVLTPEPETVEDTWLTHSSLEGVVSTAKLMGPEIVDPSVHEALTWNPGLVTAADLVPVPEAVVVEPEAVVVQPEAVVVQPEAVVVEPEAVVVEPEAAFDPIPELAVEPPALDPSLLIAEPAPEPSPYAPAVLPARTSDVSELLDSFHVTGAAEERELRAALKEMAGLDLTPLPRPYAQGE